MLALQTVDPLSYRRSFEDPPDSDVRREALRWWWVARVGGQYPTEDKMFNVHFIAHYYTDRRRKTV